MKLCIRITTVVLGVAAWLSLTHGASGGSLTFTRVVQDGVVAPGVVGTLNDLGEASISNGQVEFTGFHNGPPGNSSGIYVVSAAGGPLTLIADVGTNFPGTSNKFIDFPGATISNGVVAFQSRFTATVGDEGIFTAPSSGAGPLTTVVNGNTPIPGGSGNFRESFPPASSGSAVAFWSVDQNNVSGIFTNAGGTIHVLANNSTAVPGGSGNFQGFGFFPAISGQTVAFTGTDANFHTGVYASTGGAVSVLANTNTAIPNGTGNFTTFGPLSLSQGAVAFEGLGSNKQDGLYTNFGGSLRAVADLNTLVPGGTGNFTSFFSPPVISGNMLAFEADGAGGSNGLYLDNLDTHTLMKVLAVGDTLDGHTVEFINFGPSSLDGGQLVFNVILNGAPDAIYVASVASVPEPATWILLTTGIAFGLVCRLKKRTIATQTAN
jgi:hypothetical protein